MTVKLAYSTNSSDATQDARKGWDDFDSLVLLTVADLSGQTLADITRRAPAGVSAHLVRQSLKVLAADGLVGKVSRRFVVDPAALIVEFEVRTVYEVTEAGADRIDHLDWWDLARLGRHGWGREAAA